MTSRPLEREMLAPVKAFLRTIGCTSVVHELPFFDRGIDVYALTHRPRRISFAVELKLYNWKKALRQAAIYQLCCDFSYVALPQYTAIKIDHKLFLQSGIGVLSLDSTGSVKVMIEPRKSTEQRAYYLKQFRKMLKEETFDAEK